MPEIKSDEKEKSGEENGDHRWFDVNSHFPTSRVKRSKFIWGFAFALVDDRG